MSKPLVSIVAEALLFYPGYVAVDIVVIDDDDVIDAVGVVSILLLMLLSLCS
jgi:hypothetical protein